MKDNIIFEQTLFQEKSVSDEPSKDIDQQIKEYSMSRTETDWDL
jgi:hypothetical protein